MSQEDEEKIEPSPEEEPWRSEMAKAEMEAGHALINGLIHTLYIEQSKSRLYFMLIPLAFSFGLLLGYYISFTNL